MAQTLCDTSPTRSFQGYKNNAAHSSLVDDKMKTASAKLSHVNYNMSQGRSAPKQRLSRLELNQEYRLLASIIERAWYEYVNVLPSSYSTLHIFFHIL